MTNLPIIDSHLHLWDKVSVPVGWLPQEPRLDRPFVVSDYFDATSGLNIQGLVFVEAGADEGASVQEAQWVTSLAAAEPRIKRIIACARLGKGQEELETLDALTQFPLVKGVRSPFLFDADHKLSEDYHTAFRKLAAMGWSLETAIGYTGVGMIADAIEPHPDMTFVLDHAAFPPILDKGWEPWASDLRRLGKMLNSRCKLSSLTAGLVDWKAEDIKPYIDHIIECFGTDHVLYGADWPVCTLSTTYKRWMEAVEWALQDLSDEDQKKIYFDNAVRTYGLVM